MHERVGLRRRPDDKSASRTNELFELSPAPERLAAIRALERADLPEIAALFELVLGSGARVAEPAVIELFERTFLDNPWADPELPSLVAVDERGRTVGFIGAEVRRMRFRERSVRAVWSQSLVVEPVARRLGVGAVLLGHMLKGAQDATLTDSASQTVQAMWQRLGGQSLDLKGVHWVTVFRPWRVAAHLVAPRLRPRFRRTLWPPADALDAVTGVLGARYLEPAPVDGIDTELTPDALLGLLPTVARRLTLYPDYDQTFLEWLFSELVMVPRRGRLIARSVRDRAGRPLGWYVYYLRPGWRSEVLQVAAQKRDVGRVLDHLFRDAYAQGSAALRGRVEPGLLEPVVQRKCLLRHRGGALVDSRDPELLCAVHSDQSLVTRLEGEWWGDALV